MDNAKHKMIAIYLPNLVEATVVGFYARKLARFPQRALVHEQNKLSTKTDKANNQTEYWSRLIARVTYPWFACVFRVSQGVIDDLVSNLGIAKKNQCDRQPRHFSGRVWKSYSTIGPPLVQARSATHCIACRAVEYAERL